MKKNCTCHQAVTSDTTRPNPEPKLAEYWSPSSIKHEVVDVGESWTDACYPSWEQRPPDWFRPT